MFFKEKGFPLLCKYSAAGLSREKKKKKMFQAKEEKNKNL